MNEELQKEYIKKMKECLKSFDEESAHFDADLLLCELLEELGYKELIKIYRTIPKWYA